MARKTKLERDIEKLAGLFTPRIRKAFLASIADIKSRVTLRRIIEAIQAGDVEAAFRATGIAPAALRPISAMIEQAFEEGGVTTAGTFPKGLTDGTGQTVVFRFDVRNSRAEAWLRDHSSTLVTRITDEARTVIRNTMEAGVEDGRNPRNIALDIVGRIDPTTKRRTGGTVGLTVQQTKWVTNARRALTNLDPYYFNYKGRDKRFDSVVRKAIDAEKPLSSEQVQSLIDRYSDTLLRQRGEMIARTEAIQSLNRAQYDAFMQAVDEGAIKAHDVTKTWDSAGDLRVRMSHNILDGKTAQLDQTFSSNLTGARLLFPGDISHGAPAGEIINCRCRIRYDVDWFADID